MAKCTVKDEPVYELTLSKLEAETLYRLVGNHIVGSGLRKITDGIYYALDGHGFSDEYIECKGQYERIQITEDLPK